MTSNVNQSASKTSSIASLRSVAALALAVGLSGCAVTPISALLSTYEDTKGTTPRVFVSKQDVDAATACAIKNMENKLAAFMPMVGPAPAPAVGKEIKARSAEAGMAAVVEIKPIDGGSEISVWVSNHYPFKGIVSERISNGC